MKDNELWLIEQSRKGNVEAFEELIKEHKKSAYNIALRVLRNVEDAEDISQEALIKVFKNIHNFNMQSTFRVWMYRIVVNACLDFKRKKTIDAYSIDEPIKLDGNNEIHKEIEDNTNNPDAMIEKNFNSEMVNKAVNKLDDDFKTIIILRDIKGFSYQEISEILSCNLGTVKSRLNRARSNLKQIIQEELKIQY
nr:sigma-70 family RNA polymerase sigma factor [Sedimentibacter sp.]